VSTISEQGYVRRTPIAARRQNQRRAHRRNNSRVSDAAKGWAGEAQKHTPRRERLTPVVIDTPDKRSAGSVWDRYLWPWICIGLCAVATIAPEWFSRHQDPFGLLVAFLLMVLIFLFCGVSLIFALVRRRPSLAVTAIAGMAIIAGGFWATPIIDRALDELAFWKKEATFDKMVADQRTKVPAGRPVRMVVEFDDRSQFVTATLFEYVIYDETDQAERNPASLTDYWPYPGSNTGVVSVDGDKTVKHISGHYYRAFVSY